MIDITAEWNRGMLIAVCGIDGSGKSSLIPRLSGWMRSSGYTVVETKQPTDFYRSAAPCRAYHYDNTDTWVESLALLSAADRLLHVRHECLPILATGAVVVSHRFLTATFAIFECREVDALWLRQINRFCPEPHATILLDCPGRVAVDRIASRGGETRSEERSVDCLERIRLAYLRTVPRDSIVIDATSTVDEIVNQAQLFVAPLLESRDLPRHSRV